MVQKATENTLWYVPQKLINKAKRMENNHTQRKNLSDNFTIHLRTLGFAVKSK